MKTAIVMPSIGDRPWARASGKTFQIYADRIGADLHMVSEYPDHAAFPFPDLADEPGRKHKRAYACKTYFAWSYLADHGYDRVLVVDDTCVVRPTAPSLFDLVPEGMCGYTGTNPRHAHRSFDGIRSFMSDQGLPPIDFNPVRYMNSGVMLYDRAAVDAIHKDKICAAADLMFSPFPNQSLTYYLLESGDVARFLIPKTYNAIPAAGMKKVERQRIKNIVPHMQDRVQIFHITSAYAARREKFVRQIAKQVIEDARVVRRAGGSTLADGA